MSILHKPHENESGFFFVFFCLRGFALSTNNLVMDVIIVKEGLKARFSLKADDQNSVYMCIRSRCGF